MIIYRPLTEADFPAFYQATLAAFADYAVPYQPTEDSVRRMLVINGVDYDLSVGAFDGDRMVGFTINAAGEWNGKRTVYDSGTGVVPEYRRRNISRDMFDFIRPRLSENRIEQYLLEVICDNEPAVRLYQSLGFETTRRLLVFKRQEPVFVRERKSENFTVKRIETLDWDLFESFQAYVPSWQNSIDSMKRSLADETIVKTFTGVYAAEELIGYAVVFHNSGSIPQLAVSEKHRRKGFGRALLNHIQKQTEKPLTVNNVDAQAGGAAAFLEANGFSLLTTQYEMLLKL